MELGRPDDSENDKKAKENAIDSEHPLHRPIIPEGILFGDKDGSKEDDEDDASALGKKHWGLKPLLPALRIDSKQPQPGESARRVPLDAKREVDSLASINMEEVTGQLPSETIQGDLLARVGVEAGFRYLGDRKSRRTAKQGTINLQKQVDSDRVSQEQTFTHLATHEMRSDQVNRRRDEFEKRAARAFERQQRQMADVMTDKVAQAEGSSLLLAANEAPDTRLTEKSPLEQRSAERPNVPVPETDKFAEIQAVPEVVMEQVAVAAEYDTPLERAYERRQEVKDDPTANGGSGAGKSVTGKYNQTQDPDLGMQSYTKNFGLPSNINARDQQGSYRSAATKGITAALVIIVFALIAYLLLR